LIIFEGAFSMEILVARFASLESGIQGGRTISAVENYNNIMILLAPYGSVMLVPVKILGRPEWL
jgi:hypothetical protein